VQVLSAHGVSKFYGVAPALRPTSLRVCDGDRIAVVGPNGIGKSTLLRVMAGLERPDRGKLVVADGARVGHIPQEPEPEPLETLRDYLARRSGVRDAELAVESLAARLAQSPELGDAYSRALDRLALFGGDAFDSRCRSVCRSLGLTVDPARPLEVVSGGQLARVRLATAMLARFDVLLLDEPTNDLDFDGLARLERLVRDAPGAVVVVSHDRAFLEATATRVLAFAKETGVSSEYDCGFAEFERRSASERASAEERYRRWANDRDRFRRLRDVRRSEARAAGGQTSRRGTHAVASKVRAADRALTHLERERVEKPWRAWELRMALVHDGRTGETLVRLQDAVGERDRFRLGPVELTIGWRERVLLTGPNGSGKSTLLRMLLGTLPLTGGTRWVGPRVSIATLDQQRERFDTPTALVDVLRAHSHLDETEARTLLGHFNLLDDDVLRPARSLSPGERTRAALALLQASRAPCLALDEPTNHLDHEGIEQLESALATFPGTVLLITHDRRLIDRFASTRTLELSERGLREA
jgi:ATPase subunit of ABC transporter with duplicated ATPase domains